MSKQTEPEVHLPAEEISNQLGCGSPGWHYDFNFLRGSTVLWELNGVGLLARAQSKGRTTLALCVALSALKRSTQGEGSLHPLALACCSEPELPAFTQAMLPLTRRLAELRSGGWVLEFPKSRLAAHPFPGLLPGFQSDRVYKAYLLNPLTDQRELRLPVFQGHFLWSARQLRALRKLHTRLDGLLDQPSVEGAASSVSARQQRLNRLPEQLEGGDQTRKALLRLVLSRCPELPLEDCLCLTERASERLLANRALTELEAIVLSLPEMDTLISPTALTLPSA